MSTSLLNKWKKSPLNTDKITLSKVGAAFSESGTYNRTMSFCKEFDGFEKTEREDRKTGYGSANDTKCFKTLEKSLQAQESRDAYLLIAPLVILTFVFILFRWFPIFSTVLPTGGTAN